jgi:ABC-type bacteriocin/lantibiotic exporter with double-glycine peptidase domain
MSRRGLKLLSRKQVGEALQHIIVVSLLACLEVFSIAVIFPILHSLMGVPSSQSHSAFISKSYSVGGSMDWAIILAAVVLIFLLKNLLAIWQAYRQAKFLDRLYLDFVNRIYQIFFHQSWIDYTQSNSAESFRKIKNTAYEYTHNVLYGYLVVIPEILVCLLMVGVIVWIDYRLLFIIVILTLPILAFYFIFKRKVVSNIDRSFRELTPKANVLLSQGIAGFAEAKIYSKESFFTRQFLTISEVTTSQLSKLKTYVNVPSRIMEIIGIFCFSGIIVSGKLFPETHSNLLIFLVMLSLVIYRVIPSINKIITNISQIQAYSYVVSELEQVISSEVMHCGSESQTVNFQHSVEIRSVGFSYDTSASAKPLFGDISLSINKGDFVLLDGPSGSGKSTFMYLLAGLIHEYEGQIRIDGSLLSYENRKAWQTKVGFVQQSPVVLQDTLVRNIAFGEEDADIDTERCWAACALTCLDEFIKSLPSKLDTHVGENGLTLSGGQRQRVVLARALYRNPEILLLDEVTNQLDEKNNLLILRNLYNLSKQGKTIILISHDPTPRQFANRVLHFENGNISEEEPGSSMSRSIKVNL